MGSWPIDAGEREHLPRHPLHLGGREFTAQETEPLQVLAQQAAVATERRRRHPGQAAAAAWPARRNGHGRLGGDMEPESQGGQGARRVLSADRAVHDRTSPSTVRAAEPRGEGTVGSPPGPAVPAPGGRRKTRWEQTE
ncbi:hypothetical protein F0344_06455 [Streptomyces finlayi]|uniref:Uncharacterized protein n=1 Tax=Streptomyces finlayi TaxID=67296 RepID=A0A7G7BG31_9ACTN|nr:hypothetical protein [Streptomyces finlayi]QNE74296.1 hypothetical protein F0344_06455 [Streptomyces finlayi]